MIESAKSKSRRSSLVFIDSMLRSRKLSEISIRRNSTTAGETQDVVGSEQQNPIQGVELRPFRSRKSALENGHIKLLNRSKPLVAVQFTPEETVTFVSELHREMIKAVNVSTIDGGANVFKLAAKKTAELNRINL